MTSDLQRIAVAQTASLLTRGRLLHAMASATVTFIEAPSGYGKTSLSLQAVDHRRNDHRREQLTDLSDRVTSR